MAVIKFRSSFSELEAWPKPRTRPQGRFPHVPPDSVRYPGLRWEGLPAGTEIPGSDACFPGSGLP
eukprot:12274137-Alexandrium_andersonii.AAC.1